MTDLLKIAEQKKIRDIAREKDQSKTQIRNKLEELGFTNLRDFQNQKKTKDREKLKIDYKLSDPEKRKLQGIFGEKVTRFVEGKIKRFIKSQLPKEWNVKSSLDLRTDNSKQFHYGKRNLEGKQMELSGTNIKHHGLEKDTIREKVRKRHFNCSEYLFEKFQEHSIPSIDHKLYAIRETGREESFVYSSIDLSKNRSKYSSRDMEIDLKQIDDFKIIGLEVKTSRNSSANSMLSSLQRSIRDKAKETAFLDFYSVKVEWRYTDKLPEEVPIKIQKIS